MLQEIIPAKTTDDLEILKKAGILKSLIYFNDAEKDPLPRMIKPISWDEVKESFIKEIRNIKV